MARAVLFCVLALIALTSADTLEGCKPECRWQCSDPTCPAQCHPVCERPRCQMQCEETPCAKCTVHCEKPQCTVRCPADMCEKDNCPQCETVCSPAVCHTTCVAPDPVCTPMCEETKCDWKCKKPINCERPKCELQCEKPKCATKDEDLGSRSSSGCCNCNEQTLGAAMRLANANSKSHNWGEQPSMLEILAESKFQANKGEEACCPCSG